MIQSYSWIYKIAKKIYILHNGQTFRRGETVVTHPRCLHQLIGVACSGRFRSSSSCIVKEKLFELISMCFSGFCPVSIIDIKGMRRTDVPHSAWHLPLPALQVISVLRTSRWPHQPGNAGTIHTGYTFLFKGKQAPQVFSLSSVKSMTKLTWLQVAIRSCFKCIEHLSTAI